MAKRIFVVLIEDALFAATVRALCLSHFFRNKCVKLAHDRIEWSTHFKPPLHDCFDDVRKKNQSVNLMELVYIFFRVRMRISESEQILMHS